MLLKIFYFMEKARATKCRPINIKGSNTLFRVINFFIPLKVFCFIDKPRVANKKG